MSSLSELLEVVSGSELGDEDMFDMRANTHPALSRGVDLAMQKFALTIYKIQEVMSREVDLL